MSLSEEQAAVLSAMDNPRPMLVTGKAGTGKSFLLEAIKEKYPDIAITASTGIAALNVGGQTLHSFCGLGMSPKDATSVHKRLRNSKRGEKIIANIKQLKTMAIDEISMMGAHTLDICDGLFQAVRKNGQPFGGVKVVKFGDFLQLPPVNQEFAFNSQYWREARPSVRMLTKIFRQEDAEFARFLSIIREAPWTVSNEPAPADLIDFFRERMAAKPDPESPPVALYTTNVSVDAENEERLKAIDKEPRVKIASEWGNEYALARLDKDCRAPKHLKLKEGARVMLLTNVCPEGGLANGSLGTVREIRRADIRVEFDAAGDQWVGKHDFELKEGRHVVACRTQFPLRLAWAITMHKSQGLTMDAVRVFMGERFCPPGAAYVALSRCRTASGLYIGATRPGAIKANLEALAFYDELGLCGKY